MKKNIKIPKKSYKVYFKQPNKIKANTKGFGILPNTGIFTSPEDNFDNLKSLRLNPNAFETKAGYIMITGILIPDSLKAQFPNEYAKLTFDPLVDVLVDTNKWVIKTVTCRIDTVKLFEIVSHYKQVEDKYYLPDVSRAYRRRHR